jgi:NitT/TauT family transport system substrate-binding protein
MVAKDSPIQTPADLVGKTIAVIALNSQQHFIVRMALEQAGVDPDKVKFIQLPPDSMDQALASGQVDAAVFTEPFMTVEAQKGSRVILKNEATAVPADVDVNGTGYLTTKSFLADHPDLVQDFYEAVSESISYSRDHQDEMRAVIPEFTDFSLDQANAMKFGQVYEPGFKLDGVQWTLDNMLTQGFLKKAPSVSDLIYKPTS